MEEFIESCSCSKSSRCVVVINVGKSSLIPWKVVSLGCVIELVDKSYYSLENVTKWLYFI